MLQLLTLHVLMALGAPAIMRRLGRRAFILLALAPASLVVYALTISSQVHQGTPVTQHYEWIPQLAVTLSFRIDTLSWIMLLIVGGIGALVLIYCAGYFSTTATSSGRFGAVFVAFAGAMAGLVTAENTIIIFTFWELTTVFSYLLIGHYSDRKPSRRAAMQAIVVTTTGGLIMLVGLIILGESTPGGYELSVLLENPVHSTATTVALVCILIGAASKSALVPLHFWLPAAMAAPTPVSSYLHAAAMVKAGVYLVARFAPAYGDQPTWQYFVLIVGFATFLLGGYRALRQHDLKLILAYGTVSQLGLLFVLVGTGSKQVALAGVAMLVAHAMFKAALFLTTGAVDVITGTRDLRRLSGVGKRVPILAWTAGLAVASMIGLPVTAGYLGKEAALEAFAHYSASGTESWIGPVAYVIIIIGSAMTAAYGLRFWWGAFATKPASVLRTGEQSDDALSCIDPNEIRRPSLGLCTPPLILAIGGVLLGFFPSWFESLIEDHASAYPTGNEGHLALWSGFSPALVGTVIALVGGLIMFLVRDRVEIFQQRIGGKVEADYLYRKMMRKLDDVAADVTGVTQRGSLPLYVGVIFSVFIVGGGIALALSSWPQKIRLWDSPAQVVPVAIIVIAVVLAVRSRRRLKAVLLAGFGGYAVSALFILHGAPDLALTQILVETITLVVMVLVLRKLPPYFSDRPLLRSRWIRLTIAIGVGIVMMGLALVASGARIHLPVSHQIAQWVYEYGGGRNIVNVILVDTRAWDTMGEISVLLVAATGIASLVFLRRRTSNLERVGDLDQDSTSHVWATESVSDRGAALRRRAEAATAAADAQRPTWLRAGRTLAPQRRSLVFEVVTRLVFHPIVLFAAYLLFSGHNNPGGGFTAGLIVGIGLAIRYLAGGRYELAEALPVQPGLLLGLGLVISVGTGLAGLIVDGSVLQSSIWHFTLPIFGEVKMVSSWFFDVGVFLVVVGLVLDVLHSLGAEIDKQGEVVP